MLKINLWDEKIVDEKSKGLKVYPQANGEKISNSGNYLGAQGLINFKSFVDQTPVFDYFYLYSSSYQSEYDWILLDTYTFVGENTPSIRGFLVSKKFKEILQKFQIAKPHRFYPSKLKFQDKKLDYFIFHLAQDEWSEFQSEKSCFFAEREGIQMRLDVHIRDNRDLKKLMRKCKDDGQKLVMDIHLTNYADIFFFSQFNYVVSERLKEKLETDKLKGINFEHLENLTFSFTNMML